MSSIDFHSISSVSFADSGNNPESGQWDIDGGQTSETQELCILCRHLDLGYIGFHKSSEYSSNNYSVQREYPALFNSSQNCTLCHKVVGLLESWNLSNGQTEYDISRSRIDIRLETDWHPIQSESPEEQWHSDRLRINCAVPKANAYDTNDIKYLTFFFQKYEDESDSLLESDVPYIGRKRPLLADLTLFKGWKEKCQKLHGEKCSQIFKGSERVLPRLIDVEQRCLVPAKGNDQWVCLSYVWGKRPTLRLTKDVVDAFSKPGSLSADILPNIVEDSLQVTKGLNERYLWVDSLCIIQDDNDDKARFITRMDSIYTFATVVIVAATCVDAYSYLPGARPGTRYQEPEPFNVGGATLIQCLDPVAGVKVDLRTGRAAAYLGDTIWDTRAWTLQERFLASRSLVFTAEQVFWECEEAFWCEDSFREIPTIWQDPHRTSLCRGELNISWSSDIVTFDHYYRVLLEEYSSRALSFDSDGLNAFSGIILAFERSMKLKFYWGLPTNFLESALAWGNRTHKLRRRGYNADGSNMFPSWSWAGWTGDGLTKLDNQNLITERLGLEFYYTEEGQVVKLKQQGHSQEVDLLSEGSNIANRSSRPYTVAELPKDLPPWALCFWTASTYLDVKIKDDLTDKVQSDMEELGWEMTMSQGSTEIKVSWYQLPSLKDGDMVEIIAVAQNRGDWDGGHVANGAIGVMVISWKGGIAFREGFAWMAIRDWTALKDRSWKLIILG